MEFTEQEQYLVYLTEKGAIERYGEITAEIRERLEYELNVIISKGFTEYFLVLEDIVKYCKANDIALGPGRGSAGGSVVAYCLYITKIDPLQFDLLFDRFLNSERNAMPDIDVDVCWSKRQQLIEYVVEKYGHDKVAQIMTCGTLSLKTMLDDLGRVYQIPLATIKKVKEAVVEDGDKMTLARALENPGFKAEFDKLIELEPRMGVDMPKLEGLHRHGSIHAGGVIVSKEPIVEIAPVYMSPGKDRPIVQYEMKDAEAVGLLKMDLLGLRTVTHIYWAEQYVREHYDPDFCLDNWPLDDQMAFDIINRGHTAGIFQLEGNGITSFAQRMRMDDFNDIVALLALYRPGPLDSGSAEQFIKRKHGEEKIEYPHESLEPVLRGTQGIIIYQEQVMSAFRVMAGYSLGQADSARRAMGKKDKEVMEAELATFRKGALERGYDIDTINHVADLIATFARYGFNKSHGVAYAFLTYWTAVLKARYPDAFYTAWLNVTDTAEKHAWIIDLALKDGIKVLPPDVNLSQIQFAVTRPNEIRFGLQAVKGCGEKIVKQILNNRELAGPYLSYYDFCTRLTGVPIDKKMALIKGGAFDFDPNHHRGELLHNAKAINLCAKTPHIDYMGSIDKCDPLTPLEMGELEKETINFYVTLNPITLIQEEISLMGGCYGIPAEDLPKRGLIGGRVMRVHTLNTKKGDPMAFVDIDDGVLSQSITVFPQAWKKYKEILKVEKAVTISYEKNAYNGKFSLIGNVIEEIDMNDRRSNIEIDLGQPSPMQMAQLKMALDKAPAGRSKVYLRMNNGQYQFRLMSKCYNIKITDELLVEIQSLFGRDATKLL